MDADGAPAQAERPGTRSRAARAVLVCRCVAGCTVYGGNASPSQPAALHVPVPPAQPAAPFVLTKRGQTRSGNPGRHRVTACMVQESRAFLGSPLLTQRKRRQWSSLPVCSRKSAKISFFALISVPKMLFASGRLQGSVPPGTQGDGGMGRAEQGQGAARLSQPRMQGLPTESLAETFFVVPAHILG